MKQFIPTVQWAKTAQALSCVYPLQICYITIFPQAKTASRLNHTKTQNVQITIDYQIDATSSKKGKKENHFCLHQSAFLPHAE